MSLVYKILTGKDNVQSESWFRRAGDGPVRTRQAAGLMNVVKPRVRLELRENFFSVRAVDSWNKVPDVIKMARNAGHFKQLYSQHRRIQPRQDETQ
jgi:hypothetical protein